MFEEIRKYKAEFLRALRNHKYEHTPEGLLFTEAKVLVKGQFGVSVNGSPMEWADNLVVNQALNDILDVYLRNQSQTAAWYVAPFAGNVTPGASLTAATFTATTTEFTNYDEATRVVWTPAAAASQSITNTASKARFTISTGGGTVYGAGLISASAKSATTGKLFAGTRFAASRVLVAADLLDVAYTSSMTSS